MKDINEELSLKKVLIYSTMLNIENTIDKLKITFITNNNQQYLEFWFYFFELDFFRKNLVEREAEYQWMQSMLTKYKKNDSVKDKENEFLLFKAEKKKLFPWDEVILIKQPLLNIENTIDKLKITFITNNNQQYLEFWFYFFELDFFRKNLVEREAEYQWMQSMLTKYENIASVKDKENEFLFFKNEKKKLFSWDEEVEFQLFETMTTYEEQIKNKFIVENKKEEKELYENHQKHINILDSYDNNHYKLVLLERRKKNKFFKIKSKIVKFLTFGYYNFETKLINKITIQKETLEKQNAELIEVKFKIDDIKSKLNQIKKEFREKNQMLACLKEEFVIVNNEIKLINLQNNNSSSNNSKLTTQL